MSKNLKIALVLVSGIVIVGASFYLEIPKLLISISGIGLLSMIAITGYYFSQSRTSERQTKSTTQSDNQKFQNT